MAESELSVLSGQCLDRRISDKPTLTEEVAAWEHSTSVWCAARDAMQARMQPPRKARVALTDSTAGEGTGSKKEALNELLREAARQPDLLAMRRAVMEQRMAIGADAVKAPPKPIQGMSVGFWNLPGQPLH